MPGQRPEEVKGAEEKHPRGPAPEPADSAEPVAAVTPREAKGGWRAWLPLGVAVVAMPLVAYAVTVFVLAPRLQRAMLGGPASSQSASSASAPEGPARPGQRQSVVLSKLLVNVAGTMGSRYLLASITVMGDGQDFRARFDAKEAQLRDMASGLLMSKTIADLEKPGARNIIRGELLTGINGILGQPGAQEVYFTEFAIQ